MTPNFFRELSATVGWPALGLISTLLLSACGGGSSSSTATGNATVTTDPVVVVATLTPIQALGERLFFDENLSDPIGQSCGTCHLPSAGFADPDLLDPVSEGANMVDFGSRNTPTASYASHIPDFEDLGGGEFIGGQFLDGRASTLELQAQMPFLNPLEMNMADEAAVIAQVRAADYADDFRAVFGANALDTGSELAAYVQVSEAIASFERSSEFSLFNAKFDDVSNGQASFTASELNGQQLFNSNTGGDCRRCHNSGAAATQVFSDFKYNNIGVPTNPANPFLVANPAFVDLGLGALEGAAQNGKFRTPTLRNVALTPPYMHNGVFDTLQEVVEFYNLRDVDAVVPEVNQNIDQVGNIGELGLTPGEIADLVAFGVARHVLLPPALTLPSGLTVFVSFSGFAGLTAAAPSDASHSLYFAKCCAPSSGLEG